MDVDLAVDTGMLRVAGDQRAEAAVLEAACSDRGIFDLDIGVIQIAPIGF